MTAVYTAGDLLRLGKERAESFCKANSLTVPDVYEVSKEDWQFDVCAFYRPDTREVREWSVGTPHMREIGYGPGVNVCLQKCARPGRENEARNWNYPGCVTDRTPYGVIAHELGHHADWHTGDRKGSYFSDYGEGVMRESGERPLTSYCPNPAEWFAEMFRLFVTNHALLSIIRHRTWEILRHKWEPVSSDDWQEEVGSNIPGRIYKVQRHR